MKSIFKILTIASVILFTYSCKKETQNPAQTVSETDTDTLSNLTKIGETYIIGAKAKAVIYAKNLFETGYNDIYVGLYDSTDGSKLTDGHLTIMPMMDMGTMVHSSPVENPTSAIATNGYYKAAVVFSMPGNATEWSLNLSFHNHKNNLEGEGSLGVAVVASSPAKFISTILPLDSNVSVLISLIKPSAPVVGLNDFEIVLHKKSTMMDFPAIDNYRVEIEPEMPSMGHGSPDNVNPVLTSNGHYLGKVNFTMSGLWKINLKLYKDTTLLSDNQSFEITLK